MLPQTEPRAVSLQFVLPLNFVNAGYAEGVIEWVALKFLPSTNGEEFVCGPVGEVDLVKFIQGRRHLHPENMLGPFLPFPLESKKSIGKAVLFSPEPSDGAQRVLIPDDYRMDVYLKASGRAPVKMISVERALTPKLIADFAAGGSIFVANREIKL